MLKSQKPKPEPLDHYTLDFEKFDSFYGDTIDIPPGAVFWRGYDPKFPVISSRPSYYGYKDHAKHYIREPSYRLGAFTNTKQLELLDVRFMKALLREFFQSIKTTEKLTDKDEELIMATTTSFGLCSLGHQIKLLKYIYRDNLSKLKGLPELEKLYNPNSAFELQGVRVGETTLDSYTMGFLKGLFRGIAHGFIAPRLETPFHIEKRGTINPEIILFDPEACGIISLPERNIPDILPSKNIMDLIFANHHYIVSLDYKPMHTSFFMSIEGGGSRGNRGNTKTHPLDKFNEYMNKEDIRIKEIYDSSLKCGNRWNNKYQLYLAEAPSPTIPISLNFRKSLELD